MALLFAIAFFHASAGAQGTNKQLDINDGCITITDQGYKQGDDIDITPYTGAYTIIQTDADNSTSDSIQILSSPAGGTDITLEGVNIKIEEERLSPISLSAGTTVNLTLGNKENKLISDAPGVRVRPGATLTVKGNGKLNIKGLSNGGACIGGDRDETCGKVTVESGTLLLQSNGYGAGIGVGNGANAKNAGEITINGGYVEVKGYDIGGAAGIGGGGNGSNNGGYGGTITINGGTVIAEGSGEGAGIGGGNAGDGGIITITGGKVVATGGEFYSSAGSGIGFGGRGGSTATITITGGVVTATGKGSMKGINGTATITGDPVIFANSIDQTNKNAWEGIIVEGNTGQVYGDQTLTSNFKIGKDTTLTIPAGTTLTLNTGVYLTNIGTLKNDGTLTNAGTIRTAGTISERDKLTGTIIDLVLLENNMVEAIDDQTYTGSVIEPAITLNSYTEITDYTFAYSDNTNAGTGKVTVTPSELGALYGDPVEVTFNINPAGLTVTPKSGQVLYRGEPLLYDYTGAIGGDTPSLTGALALTDGGSGTWTIEMGTLASDDNNYTPVLNLAGVTFTYIDQDPASVDVTLTPDGNDGWHKSEITFKADNFEAALTGSSDLKSTPAYGESFVWDTDGSYTLTYNLRRTTTQVVYGKTANVKLDKTAPILTAQVNNLAYTLTFSDATSGVKTLKVDGDVIPLVPGATTYSSTGSSGTHTAVVTDVAGNQTSIPLVLRAYVPPVTTYYTVTLPSVKGVTLSKRPGDYTVEEGYNFTFTLTLDAGYDLSVPKVTTSRGETLEADANGRYRISNVEEDITVSITGIVLNEDPTANAEIEGDIWVRAAGSTLYIYTPKEERVSVYTLTGYLLKQQRVTGSAEIGMPAGLYMVRVADKVYKVVIR